MDQDRLQKRGSPAFEALSPAGRAVLTAVENEIARGGGVAVMDFNSIVRRADMSRGATANGLKQIEMLGFASIDMGPSPRFIRTMKLSDRWQRIDADEAERLALKSRLPMAETKRAAVQAVPPRMERRQPSLPRMPWDDAR